MDVDVAMHVSPRVAVGSRRDRCTVSIQFTCYNFDTPMKMKCSEGQSEDASRTVPSTLVDLRNFTVLNYCNI